MAFTPPSDAVVRFTPPSDAVSFKPPSDAEVKHKTSALEDIGIGLENLGHTAATAAQMVGGGLAGLVGADETSDSIFDAMTKRREERKKYEESIDQGTGGKIISGITGIVPVLPAALLGAAAAFAAAAGMSGMGALEQGATNVENGMSNGRAITQAMLEGGMDTAAMAFPAGKGVLGGAGLGASGNVASQFGKDVTGQLLSQDQKQQEAYRMTPEKYVIAAATGAIPGGVFGAIPEPKAQATPTPKPEATPKGSAPEEAKLLATAMKQIDAELEYTKQFLNENLVDKSEDGRIIQQTMEARQDKLLEQKAGILAGRDADPMLIEAYKQKLKDEMNKDVIAAAGEKIQAEPNIENMPDHMKNQGEPLPDALPREKFEHIPMPAEERVLIPHKEDITKTTPTEVAATKIAEAMAGGPEVAARMQEEALQKWQDTDKSATKEALGREIEAYQAIIEGKEPDLSKLSNQTPVEKPVTEAPVVEEITIEAPKEQFGSIQDLTLKHGIDEDAIVGALEDNPHLIVEGKGNVKFDKSFTEDVGPLTKKATDILQHFLDVTGLSSDKIYVINNEDLPSIGRADYNGNSGLLMLNLKRNYNIAEVMSGWDSVKAAVGLKGKRLQDATNAFMVVRVGAHEIGHMLLNRYLKSYIKDGTQFANLIRKFDEYKAANKMENIHFFDYYKNNDPSIYRKRQEKFHEFFAEQVAKELIYKHTLGAFSKGKSKPFEALMNASIKKLEESGFTVDKKNFVTQMMDSIIAKNKESIKATGETLWAKRDREDTDKLLSGEPTNKFFEKMSLEQTMDYSLQNGMMGAPTMKKDPFIGLDLNDLDVMSTKAADRLGSGKAWIARNFFGAERLADFNEREPYVHNVMQSIRSATEYATQAVNWFLNGDVDTSNMRFRDTLRKQTNPESVADVLKTLSDADAYHLLTEYQKGFEAAQDYETTAKNANFDAKQGRNWNILSKLFHDLGYFSIGVEDRLNKKNILTPRAGWFPAEWRGRFTVALGYGDIVSHVEAFPTKLAAERFLEQIKKAGYKNVDIGEIVDSRANPIQPNKWMADVIAQNLKRMGNKTAENNIQRILDLMNERGGKMGKHHEFRQGVGGYLGDQSFKTKEEQGRAFKEAIEKAIRDKGNHIKQMMIDQNVKSILDNEILMSRYPKSRDTIQQLYDSALGKNMDITAGVGDIFHDKLNRIVDSLADVIGIENDTSKNKFDQAFGSATNLFFYTKMIPSISFTIMGQFLSMPAGVAIVGGKGGHSLEAYKSFAKGMYKLKAGDEALWNAIKEDSQKYDVFSASFIESMDLHSATNKLETYVKKALLEGVAQRMDSASRVLSYAVMYEHSKAINKGLDEEGHRAYARKSTDAIIGVYDKASAAPVFSKLGVIGKMMQPLVGFGQNQQGLILNAVQNMSVKDYKTWGPIINYVAMTMVTGGLLSLPFMQEYEALRKLLAGKFGDFALPSILDITANSADVLSRVTPISDEEWAKMLYLGAFSSEMFGGIDYAKSSRANKAFLTIAAAATMGQSEFKEVFPVADWARGLPGDAIELAKYGMGGSDVGSAKKAAENILPTGHLGYLGKEAMGLNTTQVMGKNTNMMPIGKEGKADMQRTPRDIVAGLLGTKSTQQRFNDQINLEIQEKEQTKKDKVENIYKSLSEKDPSNAREKVLRLVKLGQTASQIQSTLGTEVWNRVVDNQTRLMISKKGSMSKTGRERAAQIFNFRNSEDD